MARRNPRSHESPGLAPRSQRAAGGALAVDPDLEADAAFAAWLGERCRRVALGATVMLMVARVYWPSEPDYRLDAGSGMVWIFALLLVAGLGVASALIGGASRFRFSWADAALVVLAVVVGMSAGHAADRRPAINLAWEWGGIVLAYLLARNLPRTRGESQALALALAATAFAVSIYGFYQVGVEIPLEQRQYLSNRAAALRIVGIEPGSPQQALFEDRLLGSKEPFATFGGLANSLAGFLVGPLVVLLALGWSQLTGRGSARPRLAAAGLLAIPILALLVCLLLTKSRSACVGLAVGLAAVAWSERRRVSPRTLAIGAVGFLLVTGALIVGGLATGRLDKLVLTQSSKSLRYRQEYWIGAWRAINATSNAFWTGYGPGNFSAPYVLYKLPEASEEIKDPHNFLLEAWSTAGVFAMAALALALAWALRCAFRTTEIEAGPGGPDQQAAPGAGPKRASPGDPPRSAAWLIVCGGLGWLAAFPPIGGLNPFATMDRWLILGACWPLAIALIGPAWKGGALDPAWLGAGALAVFVNLLAAGGISVPAVAIPAWALLAVAQNLQEAHACGRPRQWDRWPALAPAACWAALMGTFVGAVVPYWRCNAAMARADEAIAAKSFERGEAYYLQAKNADKYSSRPWIAMALLEYQMWSLRGGKVDDLRWRKIPFEMLKAVSPPRTTRSWSIHRERARLTNLVIRQLGDKITPFERTKLLGDVVHASRTASRLYPTSADLRARLAEASADIGMIGDALTEGREALRLDALTPHADKKLNPEIRRWLIGKIPEWEKTASDSPSLSDIQKKLEGK